VIQIHIRGVSGLAIGTTVGFALGYGKAMHDMPEIRDLLEEMLAELRRQNQATDPPETRRIQPRPDDIDSDAVEETPQGETIS
jgi:hypothetical protein